MSSQNYYHRKFLESFASENIIALFSRYKGSSKEITESWAMLEAAKKHVPDIDNKSVIVVGDGCSPRTGALFAYFTKAFVFSIDPQFNLDHWNEHCDKQRKMGFPVQRLRIYKDKLENTLFSFHSDIVVVWPHSHADMNVSLKNFCLTGNRWDIAMPCCEPIPSNWMREQHICYEDFNVLSPKRTIHIWENFHENSKS